MTRKGLTLPGPALAFAKVHMVIEDYDACPY